MPNSVIGVSRRARGLYKKHRQSGLLAMHANLLPWLRGNSRGDRATQGQQAHKYNYCSRTDCSRSLSSARPRSTFLLEMTTVDHYGQELHAIA